MGLMDNLDSMVRKYLYFNLSQPRNTWIPYADSTISRPQHEQDAAVKYYQSFYDRHPVCMGNVKGEAEDEESLIAALKSDWKGTVRQLKERGWEAGRSPLG